MAFIRPATNYIPDINFGRPLSDAQVYLLTSTATVPQNAADINLAELLTVTYVNDAGNTVEAPQPLRTTKGGCLFTGCKQVIKNFQVNASVYKFAVYDKNGNLEYQGKTNANDFVDANELAAVDSTVLVGGVPAATISATKLRSVSLDLLGVPVAPVDCTMELTAAIIAADAAGLRLIWPRKSYTHSATIAATLVNGLNWECDGTEITYTGSDTTHGIDIYLPPAVENICIGKGLSYNAGGSCHTAIRFIQPVSDMVGEITLDNISVTDTEMQVGLGVASSGIQVRGGFKSVTINKPNVSNIKMREGAGVIGSNGITGILVLSNFGVTGAYALNTYINEPKVSSVYSLDPDYGFDMDGIGVFANPEADTSNGLSYCVITKPKIKSCWGRDIKMQVGYSEVYSPESIRDEQATGGMTNPAYDFQTGSGKLLGGSYEIGAVTASSICRFSGGVTVSPVSSIWSGGVVRIHDDAVVNNIFTHDVDANLPSSTTAENITVLGTVREFCLVRTNGNGKDYTTCKDITVREITEALFRVESRGGGSFPYLANVSAENCVNQTGSVKLVRKGVSGNSCNARLHRKGCFGFTSPVIITEGADTDSLGACVAETLYYQDHGLGGGAFAGTEKKISFLANTDVEYTLPIHGYSDVYTCEIIMLFTRQAYAKVSVDTGGIVTIYAGTAVQVGATSDPGSGDLRIWRSGGQLVIKNANAGNRPVMIKLVG